ncbi:LysR family transcriptional regulator, hydrogen peroxide-inducible genes activator [Parapedobacter luteus]|uniref:LysR family transcriptional regulator, hydrogen peroxide-inducible genes activator n=1 Tax=Parapedobacter luteus TaxID=623280 RepID=A0A1T5C8L9_9SPHI|nr:hydrogen peroxide-inducible genes activator [Parapedobacter luteus]SKB55767.1 LysR family transcriptional regulator, hydrogen peroxide-inducible genes activator [Parapedobacter luteus]
MTLVQLEYIIAVDTYRSFVAAAEKCFVTQPTLSMQIQKLEESIGARIFDRSRQPIVPTEVGVEIIKQARVVLTESRKINELVQLKKGELEGELRIGVIPTIAPYLLPRVLGNFMQKFPKLQLQIWEYTTEKIVRELKVNLLDCGVLSTPVYDTALVERPLFYEPFVAYISPKSALIKKKEVTPEDVLEDKLWLLTEGHCMRGQVLNICQRKRSMDPDGTLAYNTGSVETLKRMVDSNSGTTILPELSIDDFDEDQLGRVRYFKSPEPVREISLVTTHNFLKRQAIDALEREIIASVPKRFRTKKKKDIMEID